MNFFYTEPEVAGDLGSNTILDRSVLPPRVNRLHYEFDIWLGDALLETFPCLIALETAANALKAAGMTGVEFDKVETSMSPMFEGFHPNFKLPPFVWLRVTGIAGRDDFGVAPDRRFVISERALDLIRPFGLKHAEMAPFR